MRHADTPQELPPLDAERRELLARLEDWLEMPMLVPGFVWLALLILEFTRGLPAALETMSTIIWIVFILDFALKLALAPDKSDYLKVNWLTALALGRTLSSDGARRRAFSPTNSPALRRDGLARCPFGALLRRTARQPNP